MEDDKLRKPWYEEVVVHERTAMAHAEICWVAGATKLGDFMSMVAAPITLRSSLPSTTIMNTATTSAEAIKLEIERLKGLPVFRAGAGSSDHSIGAINRAKTGGPVARPAVPATNPTRPRGNVYVNPNYKPPSQAARPHVPTVTQPRPAARPPPVLPQETRDVVIDGIAFESSGRSLVRKDCKSNSFRP